MRELGSRALPRGRASGCSCSAASTAVCTCASHGNATCQRAFERVRSDSSYLFGRLERTLNTVFSIMCDEKSRRTTSSARR